MCFVRAGRCRGLPAEPGWQPWEPLAFPSAARQDGAMDGPPCLWLAARAAASVPPATVAWLAQTAAHLVDHVIPPVPVRQWVISVPKRLRCFLADRPNAVAALTCPGRGSTGTARRLETSQGCSPRITSSGPPSRHMTKGNVGKPRDAAPNGHALGGHAAGQDTTGDCCDLRDKPPSHDTSRIAWAKLMARVGEEFPFACPGCGGDIQP